MQRMLVGQSILSFVYRYNVQVSQIAHKIYNYVQEYIDISKTKEEKLLFQQLQVDNVSDFIDEYKRQKTPNLSELYNQFIQQFQKQLYDYSTKNIQLNDIIANKMNQAKKDIQRYNDEQIVQKQQIQESQILVKQAIENLRNANEKYTKQQELLKQNKQQQGANTEQLSILQKELFKVSFISQTLQKILKEQQQSEQTYNNKTKQTNDKNNEIQSLIDELIKNVQINRQKMEQINQDTNNTNKQVLQQKSDQLQLDEKLIQLKKAVNVLLDEETAKKDKYSQLLIINALLTNAYNYRKQQYDDKQAELVELQINQSQNQQDVLYIEQDIKSFELRINELMNLINKIKQDIIQSRSQLSKYNTLYEDMVKEIEQYKLSIQSKQNTQISLQRQESELQEKMKKLDTKQKDISQQNDKKRQLLEQTKQQALLIINNMNKSDQEISNRQQLITKLQEQQEEQKTEINQYNTENNNQFMVQQQQLEQELKTATSDRNMKEKQLDLLNKQVQQMTGEISKLDDYMKKADSQYNQAKNEQQLIQTDILSIQKNIKKITLETELLQQAIIEAEQKSKDLLYNKQQIEEQYNKLIDDQAHLVTLKEQQQIQTNITQNHQKQQNSFDAIQSRNNTIQIEIDNILIQTGKLDKLIDSIYKEIQQDNIQLEQLKKNNVNNQQEITTLKSQQDQQIEKQRNLQSQNEKLNTEYQQIGAKRDQLLSDKSQISLQLSTKKKEIQESQQKISQQQQELQLLIDQNVTNQHENDEIQQQIQNYEQQMQQMQQLVDQGLKQELEENMRIYDQLQQEIHNNEIHNKSLTDKQQEFDNTKIKVRAKIYEQEQALLVLKRTQQSQQQSIIDKQKEIGELQQKQNNIIKNGKFLQDMIEKLAKENKLDATNLDILAVQINNYTSENQENMQKYNNLLQNIQMKNEASKRRLDGEQITEFPSIDNEGNEISIQLRDIPYFNNNPKKDSINEQLSYFIASLIQNNYYFLMNNIIQLRERMERIISLSQNTNMTPRIMDNITQLYKYCDQVNDQIGSILLNMFERLPSDQRNIQFLPHDKENPTWSTLINDKSTKFVQIQKLMHTYSEDKEVLMKLLNISKTDIDNIFQKNDRDSMEQVNGKRQLFKSHLIKSLITLDKGSNTAIINKIADQVKELQSIDNQQEFEEQFNKIFMVQQLSQQQTKMELIIQSLTSKNIDNNIIIQAFDGVNQLQYNKNANVKNELAEFLRIMMRSFIQPVMKTMKQMNDLSGTIEKQLSPQLQKKARPYSTRGTKQLYPLSTIQIEDFSGKYGYHNILLNLFQTNFINDQQALNILKY